MPNVSGQIPSGGPARGEDLAAARAGAAAPCGGGAGAVEGAAGPPVPHAHRRPLPGPAEPAALAHLQDLGPQRHRHKLLTDSLLTFKTLVLNGTDVSC